MLGKSVGIIGGGLGGLSTAILLARKGYAVTVYEKDALMGGRANQMSVDGFTFDMGPSRYLMPDIFKKFFESIEEKVEDHLNLIKLDPSYKIFFKDSWENRVVEITGDRKRDQLTFEGIEPGVSNSFLRYMQSSQEQYGIAVNNFLYKNYESWKDFFTREMLFKGYKLSVFTTMASYIKKYFKTDKMQKIIEYPLVFLGTSPYDAPAIYNIMSHVDFNLGVFYPMGGIYEITKALVKIGQKYNVQYKNNAEIQKIFVNPNTAQDNVGKVQGVQLPDGQVINHDIVVVNADLEHAETKLLNPAYQTYPMGYWKSKVMAPSAFIIYLGIDKKLTQLRHHNLIFCDDWRKNFEEIFAKPQLPTDPSMYICAPSLTDPSVAPEGKENLFVLVPIAPGLQISPEEEEKYAAHIIRTVSQECDIPNLEKHIIVKKVFHGKDFAQKYNSFKGSALGLAHTLRQTAIFRPKNVSEKVEGLYYVGSYTNPGIGMPMVMISAQLVADKIGV